MDDGKRLSHRLILLTKLGGPFKPSKAYMDLIIHKAQENGLSVDYIEKLKKSNTKRNKFPENDGKV
jgi:hypothetical protein